MVGMMTAYDEPCEVCGGSGVIEQPILLGHGRIDYRCSTCEKCDGAGTLDGPLPSWLDGDYLRKKAQEEEL